LGQKRDLFQLKLSITWPSLENFKQVEDHVFVFFKVGAIKLLENLWIIGKGLQQAGPLAQCGPVPL
jgi:hypothetical protein